MFGRDWEPAEATIVARRVTSQSHTEGGANLFQGFEYVADVRPKSAAAPFRATIEDPFNGIHFKQPDVGQVVQVKFRAQDQKVKFDAADPALYLGTINKRDKQAVEAAHSGEAQAQWDAMAGADTRFDAAAFAEPAAAFRDQAAQFAEQAAGINAGPLLGAGHEAVKAILQAKAAGNQAEVERLRAELRRTAAGQPGSPGVRVVGGGSSSGGSDPIAQLQMLADLHDRGVLTDAEFAEQKARILGQT